MREIHLAAIVLGIEGPYTRHDMDRISALFDLIGIKQVPVGCCLPERHLNIPEEDCVFHGKCGCWLNAPDSLVPCEGRCECFISRED